MIRKTIKVVSSFIVSCTLLTACSNFNGEKSKQDIVNEVIKQLEEKNAKTVDIFEQHKGLNQKPTPVKIERIGQKEVNIEMTAQITDIMIAKGEIYKAWTFNGQSPGPLVVVEEGDKINFKLKNMDPAIAHSMDFHAVHASPSTDFVDVMPNEEGFFSYIAENPGVFMYHCGTKPVLSHIANGMHGVIIVKPKNGYPTDDLIDREYVMVQNEWYDYNNIEDFTNGEPNHVVFSVKAMHEGELNTNGTTYSLLETPLVAKVGEKIRIYINNVGPNEVSSFHVVGSIFDDVYIDGNPYNHNKGMQTVLLPASGGAVVEFIVKKEGEYPIVTHQFDNATKGAVALLKVTE